MNPIRYKTGRHYDKPQVLEITDVTGGWHFVDDSRNLDGFIIASEMFKEIYQTNDEIGQCVLNAYDKGEYS